MSRHDSDSSSLSGSFSPRDSRGPLSPSGASFGDWKKGNGGIQMQIQQLQNEQERVQKKTFSNWMNTYLKQKRPPLKVEDLFEDIKDGVVLLSLLEVLSGEKLPMERGNLNRVHYVCNLSTALKFIESKKIKLVNINVSDIADGKRSIVLGLIWTIILYFQIEETMAAVPQQEDEQRPLSDLDKPCMNAKKALLAWTENAITQRYGIEIRDFGKSWRDGLAFNAILHTIRPDLVDMEQVRKQSARLNLENAFSTAENHLGIAILLDPEDVDVDKPDEKSVMTYVAQFLKAYPEVGEDPALRKKRKTPAEQEMAYLQELMTWCTTEAEDVLQIVEQPVTDRQQEYMDYLAFKAEVDRRGNIYNALEEKVKSGKAVRVPPEQFAPLEETWEKVFRKTRLWLWKLDASLPGTLGKFVDWLNQAEEILEQEEMAAQLVNILQEHKKFYKDLEPNRTFFMQVQRAGQYKGEILPPSQMDNLYQRLQAVCTSAPQRERRLEYEEMKYQLLAYLVASENKLKVWTVKYGRQETVEDLLTYYKECVHNGNLFKNYEKTYDTCKKNADAYRKAKIDKSEVEKMNNYFDEVNGRWKKFSVEIKSVQSMLEEVIDCWRKYNACVDVLTVWVNDGERVMSRSADEKQQFLADLPQYEEKHKILNESGNFLIETTEEPVAAEIKQTLLMLNIRFKDLLEKFQHFKQLRKKQKTPTEQEMAEPQELMTWCTTEAEDVLQIVEQPVTDRQQEDIMEVSGRRPSKDRHKLSSDDADIYCQPCDKKGKHLPAHGFCQTCGEYLCDTCYKAHTIPTPLQHHVLLDKSSMPKSVRSVKQKIQISKCTIVCKTHPDKVIEFFCPKHKAVVCGACAFLTHKPCKLDFIPDSTHGYRTGPDYGNLKDEILQLEGRIDACLKKATTNSTTARESNGNSIEHIKTFRTELCAYLDKKEKDLLKEAQKLQTDDDDLYKTQQKECVSMKTKVAQMKSNLSKFEKESSDLFVTANQILSSIPDFESQLDQCEIKSNVSSYSFQPEQAIELILSSKIPLGKLVKVNKQQEVTQLTQ